MHQDFLRHYNVIGMTKEQLIELLGPSNSNESGLISWVMGQIGGHDDNSLNFHLKDGKVVSVEVDSR